MVDDQNLVISPIGGQALRRAFCSAELGMPQAIYELTKTYIAMRNFTEAIAWSRTLAENPNLIEQSLGLLSEIISYSADPLVIEEVHMAITELRIQLNKNQIKQKEILEKKSFLLPTTMLDMEA